MLFKGGKDNRENRRTLTSPISKPTTSSLSVENACAKQAINTSAFSCTR